MEEKNLKRVHMICNAHIDPLWQWDLPEGVSVTLSTFYSAAKLCDELGPAVARAALGCAARILGRGRTLVEIRCIAGRVDIGKVRIKRRRNISRKHRRALKCAANHNVARILLLTLNKLSHRVLEEA